nr:efflux RND transporter periplasmic adaptor subunit [Lachnospiraceae bacterium]
IIMTEATEQEEFEGQITFVAPSTSSSSNASSSSGETPSTNAADSSSDGYEVQISLNPTEEERLKLGMTAKCSIVLDEASDVLAVPYDAVKGRGDQKYISVLDDESGEEKQISVTTGMETDYYIEVQGEELKEGMKVVIPSDQVTASDPNSDSEKENSMGGFGFMGNDQPGNADKNGRPNGGDNPGDGGHSGGGKPGAAPGGNETR